jgi:hypothetical protein
MELKQQYFGQFAIMFKALGLKSSGADWHYLFLVLCKVLVKSERPYFTDRKKWGK